MVGRVSYSKHDDLDIELVLNERGTENVRIALSNTYKMQEHVT